MPKEKSRRSEPRFLDNETVPGFNVITAVSMLVESLEGAEILRDGNVRAELLIDLLAFLNNLDPKHNNNLRELPALGPNRMVAASSYESIRFLLENKLNRFFLQSMLGKIIGHVLTSEGEDYEAAATISRPHTRSGKDHTAIAVQDIADTFDEFMPELTSETGLSATTLTVEMIHKIMTDTVFGGHHDHEVASWKVDIVYFLQHLIDVQQSYAVGLFAEKLPKNIQRKLMRLVAEKQGISDVLERMLRIEDTLFPRIINWIEVQNKKNLSKEELASMGFLGAVLSVPEEERSKDMKRADIFGIYTAALDSTANAASWLLSELAQHPEILRNVAKLQGDARKQYIQFIQFELWRKDPITPIIFRQVPADQGLAMPDGTYIPPNTIVLLSVGAAGLDPVRFPNPEDFNPDRYYVMTPEQIVQVRKDLTLVFAAGDKHRCQGEGAVKLTVDALIIYMADHFDNINIAPTEDGQKAVITSNNSGVCGPVVQDGKPPRFRVVPK